MGGYGSTRWHGKHVRDTVEGNLTLNMFRLRRENIVVPAAEINGIFSGTAWGAMQFSLANNCMRLSYKIAGNHHHYDIQLEQTVPHFGGVRLWWLCPTCGRRAGKLHLARERFECRQCGHLAYQSSRDITLKKIYASLLKQDRRIQQRTTSASKRTT